MTKIFIVILNWNGLSDTLNCLESIKKLKTGNFQLNTIVVDNGSENISKLRTQMSSLQLKSKNLRLIENKENLGFAGGNNVGIKYALNDSADYVMVLNNDTIVDSNMMAGLIKELESKDRIGSVSPKIYFHKGFEFHKERYKDSDLGKVIWYAGGKIDWENVNGNNFGVDEIDNGQYERTLETDFTTGACTIFNAKALNEVGLFDEKYFLYFEDTDLSIRMKQKGWKVLYSPKGFLWHKVAQSSKIGGELNDYFITRNRLLFGMRYAPVRSKFALFRESLKLITKGRKWQRVGVKDFYLRKFGKGSWK